MSALALVASVVLGLAFVVAGGSKIAAGPAWPEHVRALGAPSVAAPVLPWVEMAVGAALITGLVEPIPALFAITLLLAFTLLIARRLSQRRHPVCACFGAWSAKPIGPGHLVRNAAMLVLAVLTLLG